MRKIAIIGASGFVGQHLTEYLGTLVTYPVSRVELTSSLESLVRLLTVNDVNAVIHLAGKAHDLKKSSSPEEYYTINTEITKKIFDAFLASDANIFIMVSSIKAVTDDPDSIVTEQDIPDPQTDYGKSKLYAEKYLLAQTLPENKRLYILRPCMIHGSGNKGNLNLLYKVVRMGIPYPLAAFQNKRSLLSVDNLCFVINELITRSDIESGIYNVSDDQPLSTNRVIELIGEITGRPARLLKVAPGLIKVMAKIGDIFPLLLDSDRLNKLTGNYEVCNRKISNAIGKKLPLSAEEGLKKTIHSFFSDSLGRRHL